MRTHRALLAAVVAASVSVACSAPASAGLGSAAASCKRLDSNTITNVSVTNMSCRSAGRVINHFGSISTKFKVDGFSCGRISGGRLQGTWRCKNGQQSFRFDVAD